MAILGTPLSTFIVKFRRIRELHNNPQPFIESESGPFWGRESAEQFCVALASNPDFISAKIIEENSRQEIVPGVPLRNRSSDG